MYSDDGIVVPYHTLFTTRLRHLFQQCPYLQQSLIAFIDSTNPDTIFYTLEMSWQICTFFTRIPICGTGLTWISVRICLHWEHTTISRQPFGAFALSEGLCVLLQLILRCQSSHTSRFYHIQPHLQMFPIDDFECLTHLG
jgi:hypothetical protein